MAFTVGNEQQSIFSRMRKMTPASRLAEFNRYQSQGGSTPFSLLTPQQFAELFPKYYMEKLPDVGGFFKALNSKKELGGEGKTYGPFGNTEGTATATPSSNERVTNLVRAKEIYDYIRSKGIDHIHATGIINNMKYESSFNSGAMGDGDTSGGLFQHHASRFSAMKNYVGEGWQTNWKKQIDFALTEGEMKSYLSGNYANAADASREFTLRFERPAHKEQEAARRAGTAEGYATAMSGSGVTATTTAGGGFETTSSGYIVPKDKTIYSPGNEQQCATLAKAMNPDIGRSSSWTVVPGEIKPGMTVATMRYNLPGGDRTGSGYHSGVAMSAPDKDGNFLLLEQFNGQTPRVRQVNVKYGGGAMGGSTQFGLISSNGKLHTEQSLEALNYGAKISDQETQKIIQNNAIAVSNGDTSGAQQGTGSVSINNADTPAGTPGPQTNLQQQETVKSIQTATIGDMFRMVGDLAGFFMRGEGIGDGRRRHGHHGHGHKGHHGHNPANAPADPSLDYDKRSAIEREAKKLNIDPHHLTSAILYESIGSMNTERMGVVDKRKGAAAAQKAGAEKRFMGLIQMGSNEQLKYGVKKGQTFNEHMVSVGRFLEDRGVKRWMDSHPNASEEEKRTALYSAINAGHPEEKYWKRTDKGQGGAPTTVRQKSAEMVEKYGERASRLLSAEAPSPTAVAAAPQAQTATVARAAPSQVASETPAQAGNGYLDQIKAKMSGYYEGFANKMAGLRSSITGQETSLAGQQPEFPTVGAKQNEVPLPPHRPTSFENTAPAAAPAPEKHTFNVERPTEAPAPKPIVADTFLNRGDPQFASPSMERQIKNTMNPVASNEGHSFLPTIG
jgi:Phage tail lysozyme